MVVLQKGQVETILDEYDGLRIKVRLEQENGVPLADIPWAFPLLPKTFITVPKVGEGAMVILSDTGNLKSDRYYIGPIISQPQYQDFCDYKYGTGNAMKLFDGGLTEPLQKLSNYVDTIGSFPRTDDVAMVGRGSQDIIMRCNQNTNSNEVDIRCGARTESETTDPTKGPVIGDVIYNSSDPAYIQLKYKKSLTTGDKVDANSMVNVVADKINIVSNQDVNEFDLTDTNELIPEDKLKEMMGKLHQIPHGDTLVKLLELIIDAIATHVHPCSLLPPCETGFLTQLVEQRMQDKIKNILSEHVRIS